VLVCSLMVFGLCDDVIFECGMECDALCVGAKRPFEYGRTHVVRPKGAHKATIVWLHGLGDNGARYGNCLTFPRLTFHLLMD
jgi:hypothetical protein